MGKVEEIRERFNRGYDGDYGTMLQDIQFLLNLFSAENNKIEVEIDKLKDYANATDDYEKAEFAINILKKLG